MDAYFPKVSTSPDNFTAALRGALEFVTSVGCEADVPAVAAADFVVDEGEVVADQCGANAVRHGRADVP